MNKQILHAPIKKASSADSLATISNVLLSTFIVSGLFFSREILIPLALATLLTFMLAPLAEKMQRWLGRIGAVLLIAALVVAATVGTGYVITRQAVDLATQLPDYKANIQKKLHSLQLPKGGQMKKISDTLLELKKELPDEDVGILQSPEDKSAELQATPVQVISEKSGPLELAQKIITPVIGPLWMGFLVLLLMIFMLVQREDLRNRLIRLAGQGRIGATTRVMDDAGTRVSRYLRLQLIINLSFGIAVAIGLSFIGIPNAILWGTLATVLRFIPYVGPWIAALFPVLLSLAVSPDWVAPILCFGLFIAIELVFANVLEPWLYGASTGVSPIALIVAALFWTFLWGPVGLVLSTPLTVCLVVMGRHVPKLAFLSILLSDEEALTPAEECYHRLQRAGDRDEMTFVDTYLKAHSPGELYDSVLIPVIAAAETDHRNGLLAPEQLELVKQGLGDMMDELTFRLDTLQPAPTGIGDFLVCCLPAKADRDEMAGEMLVNLLRQNGTSAICASSKMLTGELVAWVKDADPDLICISVLAPTTVIHARYLSSKLRTQFPDKKIIVGIWGGGERATASIQPLKDSGANEVVLSVTAACERIELLTPAREITQ